MISSREVMVGVPTVAVPEGGTYSDTDGTKLATCEQCGVEIKLCHFEWRHQLTGVRRCSERNKIHRRAVMIVQESNLTAI